MFVNDLIRAHGWARFFWLVFRHDPEDISGLLTRLLIEVGRRLEAHLAFGDTPFHDPPDGRTAALEFGGDNTCANIKQTFWVEVGECVRDVLVLGTLEIGRCLSVVWACPLLGRFG